MIKGSRLGYACVNWGLTNRKKKEGGRVTTSRTLRKATWQLAEGWDYSAVGVKALDNATDLLHYLKLVVVLTMVDLKAVVMELLVSMEVDTQVT